MFPVPEQFSAATKSQLEAQLKIINTFASGAFNSAEKIIAFNFGITKAALEKSSAAAQQMLATKDARELFKFDATRTQTDLASVLLYGQQMLGITASPLHTASAALTI
ncbi:MAG: phasin family protein, partial [Janthinobacterium sp.]